MERTPTRLQGRLTKYPFVGGNDAARPATVTVVGRAASTATRTGRTSILFDQGGGPTSIPDEDDHAMALAEHHGAT
jgi:predicted TIM-barrel enzyme